MMLFWMWACGSLEDMEQDFPFEGAFMKPGVQQKGMLQLLMFTMETPSRWTQEKNLFFWERQLQRSILQSVMEIFQRNFERIALGARGSFAV